MNKLRWPRTWVGGPLRVLLILAVSFQAGNAMRVSGGLSLPEILFLVVLTAAFLLHPRRPDAAMAVIACGLTAAAVLPTLSETPEVVLPTLYATYLASAYATVRLRPVWLVWLLAGTAFVAASDAAAVRSGSAAPSGWYVPLLLVGAVWCAVGFFWMLGAQTRRRRSNLRTLKEQAELAGVVERTRIAREMHDIVAHSLSGVIALADGARFAAAKNPQVAVDTLETISQSSREALTQMRGLLSVLRDDTDREVQAAPGVVDLHGLIDDARRSGLGIEVTGLAEIPEELPTLTQFTVYRIIQEMLTNMLRHASAPEGTIMIQAAGRDLKITARNPATAADSPGGFGLVGMRERVRAHGGRLRRDHSEDYFTVTAEIPA
ncbi:sensor histidine kinase [Corynebacterium halotolerans]|uniref:sensor histidine kinase n=1 Tax=Corynebacterium halotolerans TaxID=225326 RepID=UPI003CE84621